MSFFTDALGDPMISAGTIKMTIRKGYYESGFLKYRDESKPFFAKKSVQPLEPEEAQLMGFPDYSTNQFITIFSLKKIPMPSKTNEAIIVRFNQTDWYVRKVLPFVWDMGTPMEMGYYEVVLSRFNENEINPD